MNEDVTPSPANKPKPSKKKRKNSWVKWFYFAHWTSGAVSLLAVVFFAVTGITLNHADEWDSNPDIRQQEATLPAEILELVQKQASQPKDAFLPGKLRQWLNNTLELNPANQTWEWSDFELYGEEKAPGKSSWVAIDLETGEVSMEETKRGKVAYFNDLHRGLFTGKVWATFLDFSAIAICLFALTGLGLLGVHAKRRKSTWALVAIGVIVPVILAAFFIHA